LLAQTQGEFRLGSEAHLRGDLGPPPSLWVAYPLRGQVKSPAEGQRPLKTHGVKTHGDLAVADLAERARILALHSGGVATALGDAGIIHHPGALAEKRNHPLGQSAQEPARFPGGVGQKLLHRLVPGRGLFQAKHGGLQALTSTLLEESAHVGQGVLGATHVPQICHHLSDEVREAFLDSGRSLEGFCHLHLLATMISEDIVGCKGRCSCIELTKH
jgi:hypothetical protein